MATKISHCPHVTYIDSVTWEELRQKHKQSDLHCLTCSAKAANLWLCMVGTCQYVGCGESIKDHSSLHAVEYKHSMTINLSTLRIWCYICETEVFPNRNKPNFIIPENSASMLFSRQKSNLPNNKYQAPSTCSSPQRSSSAQDDSESDIDDDSSKPPRGLTGLQNLGNTCYLNSALQALSNCPPLSRFFLDCSGFVQPDKNPKLAKSYLRLITEMWHKKRPSYVIPSSVVNGIKVVHPMFRGYSQQDAQEFLRCFMDEIHEELKQPLATESEDEDDNDAHKCQEYELPDTSPSSSYVSAHDRQMSVDSNSSSQSEDFYETCDSGLSSERCSADINISSDDNCGESNGAEMNSKSDSSKVSDGKTYTKLRQRAGDKDDSVKGEDSVMASKHMKETVNKLSKRSNSTNTITSTTCTDDSGRPNTEASSETSSARVKSLSRGKKTSESIDAGQHCNRNYSAPKPSSKGKKKNVQYQSVISDIFDGKILSSVQCLTCERVSTTKETFQDVSLPIPTKDHLHMIHSSSQGSPPKGGSCGEVHQGWISFMFSWMKSWFVGPTITLQDCLAAFFSADELKGDNMYSCEKCKKLRNGVKFSRVMELPEILSIHLKRFRHEFYSSKISSYVSFPLDSLDMKPYTHKDCKSEVTLYDLIAVICHHGTAGAGHYTAYCLNHLNEQWYEFDDQYVTEVDISQVMNCEAYVLFYRKRNDDMISQRQKAMQLKEDGESSLLQFFVSKQWINRFNMFAEPGPITNQDFLCPHGGVPPHKVDNVEELVEPFDQSLWEYLHEKFGGGPVCNHLYACSICQTMLEKLQHRQNTELEYFIQLNDRFRDEDNPSIIYAISMSWFKEWENFVRKRTSSPPGPIDNSRICTTKGSLQVVRPNSDHGQLSEEMWLYLHSVYSGGPELVIKQHSSYNMSHNAPTQHSSMSSSSSSQSLAFAKSISAQSKSSGHTTSSGSSKESKIANQEVKATKVPVSEPEDSEIAEDKNTEKQDDPDSQQETLVDDNGDCSGSSEQSTPTQDFSGTEESEKSVNNKETVQSTVSTQEVQKQSIDSTQAVQRQSTDSTQAVNTANDLKIEE